MIIAYAMGTYGDVHPVLGICLELKRYYQGEIVIISSEKFKEIIESEGFVCHSVSSVDAYERTYNDPETWTNNSYKHVIDFHIPTIEPTYKIIRNLVEENNVTCIIGTNSISGAYYAAENMGIPFIHLYLAPSSDATIVHREFSYSAKSISRKIESISRNIQGYKFALGFYRNVIGPHINKSLSSLGLKKIGLSKYLGIKKSKFVVKVALFPEWFVFNPNEKNYDIHYCGFPLYDPKDSSNNQLIDKILNESASKPICITPGSGVKNISSDIKKLDLVCRALNKVGIYVSRYIDDIDTSNYKSLIFLSYVDFSYLLPRCELFIHHGGIGSSAAGVAAGIPQFLRVMNFDQPDNAWRLQRLGVSLHRDKEECDVKRMLLDINKIIHSSFMPSAAKALSKRVIRENGLNSAALHILKKIYNT